MSLKIKLISCISLFMLMIGVLIIGVFAATQENISISGNVSFVVADKSLWLEKVTYQEAGGDEQEISTFTPGYINGNFDIDIGNITDNQHGSFNLNFYLVNVLQEGVDSVEWAISNVTIPDTLTGVSYKTSGVVGIGTTTADDLDAGIPPTIDGVLSLTIIAPNATSLDLSGIVVTIDEYIEPVVYVNSVTTKNNSTQNTLTQFNGEKALIDLSSVEFATGETTLTISMTSLSAKYIKNIVSYDSGTVNYNTTGASGTLFVHSTSLYLPQNSSGELASGESKDLTIYVNNNTSSATTISGLKVSFEEKESLLQKDTENKYWYVEMGTVMGETESEYIRWKYIASVDDSSGSDVATKYATFDADTAPTGKGYFYLETNVLTAIGRDGTNNMIEVSFNNDWTRTSSLAGHQTKAEWTSINANDYATSNVRRYINGVDSCDAFKNPSGTSTYPYTYEPDGRESNMYDDLNIDTTNDLVYEKIVTRSLGELYKDNKNSSTNPNDVTYPSALKDGDEYYQEGHEDAFWLLSYYEVYRLTGGSSTTSSDSGRVWPTGSANFYWLRSPNSSISSIACYVSTSGGLASNNVYLSDRAARAAFKFSI